MRDQEEKRTSARSLYERPVKFDLNFVGSNGLMTIEQEGVSVDISEHGLGLCTGYPLKKDEIVKLRLPLNSAKATLPVFAKVAWSRLVEKRFRVGLEFLE